MNQYLINENALLEEGLSKLDSLGHSVLIVVNDFVKLLGTVTDGDVRRSLLSGGSSITKISSLMNNEPKFIQNNCIDVENIVSYREMGIGVLPVVDSNGIVIDVLDFINRQNLLPIDVIIMAGGQGVRLKPLTNDTPKPLLLVGDKPIIDYNIDRLRTYGVKRITITVRYLKGLIIDHFRSKQNDLLKYNFIEEEIPLGTLGAVSLMDSFNSKYILISNSDILTNIDYEKFFLHFLKEDADIAVASVPYNIQLPYAVLETDNHRVLSFIEKPTYTYYSNGGIYLIKASWLTKLNRNELIDMTELMDLVLVSGGKLISYPMTEYWLDVGKHDDFIRAQSDVKKYKL
jgi:dTDP-glucose pyrophosphorylase